MTISRAQMRRQLYMGGGIASLEPRQQYGLGSIVKSVTKAVKGVGDAVGDIVSSDLGKAALLYAGTAGLGSLGAGGSFGSLFKLGTYAPSMIKSNLLTAATRAGVGLGVLGPGGFSLPTIGKTGVSAAIGGASLLAGIFGTEEIAQDLYQSDRTEFNKRVQQYVKNLNPDKQEEALKKIQTDIAALGDVSKAEEIFRRNVAAEGGRVGLREGSTPNFDVFGERVSIAGPLGFDVSVNAIDRGLTTSEIAQAISRGDKRGVVEALDPSLSYSARDIGGIKGLDLNAFAGLKDRGFGLNFSRSFGKQPVDLSRFIDDDMDVSGRGGRTFGIEDDPSAFDGPSDGPGPGEPGGGSPTPGDTDGTPFAEGGIPSIPTGELRENAQGVQELDYRQDGGFVPVGIKEKADDVPAMLSRNEFVMTADAVRGMGNGSIEKGAQKMYNLMKSLENRMA